MMNFEDYLNQFDERAWLTAIEKLLPEMHEVDRDAVQIWFRFYPLALFRKLQTAENRDELIQKFVMQGDYELKNQVDTSHRFLYGHRYWNQAKEAVVNCAENFNGQNAELTDTIKNIARDAAGTNVNVSLLLGITAVGLMTVVQTNLEALKNSPGDDATVFSGKSPENVIEDRATDDSQGLLGFLKTVNKKWTVTYDESKNSGKFKAINDEEIASAAARDQSQDWRTKDERCIEGVIPVECRSAACGTCWVGVLGGREKLSEVAPRERKQMKIFGYNQPDEAKPFMRLACQAKVEGAVTIVIPPWNGVFGKAVYGNVEDVELEPATTSAKQNRTIVKDAVKNQLM